MHHPSDISFKSPLNWRGTITTLFLRILHTGPLLFSYARVVNWTSEVLPLWCYAAGKCIVTKRAASVLHSQAQARKVWSLHSSEIKWSLPPDRDAQGCGGRSEGVQGRQVSSKRQEPSNVPRWLKTQQHLALLWWITGKGKFFSKTLKTILFWGVHIW